MPEGVAADHSDLSLSLEQLVDELMLNMDTADRSLDTDAAAAVLQTTAALLHFRRQVAAHIRVRTNCTGPSPGKALERLHMALIDLNNGIVDPSLLPRRNVKTEDKKSGNNVLRLKARTDRIKAAVAIQILYQAGRLLEEAEEEAAKILKGRPILANRHGVPFSGTATVGRWRSEIIAGVNSDDAKIFNNLLNKIGEKARTLGFGANEMIKHAHLMLQSL